MCEDGVEVYFFECVVFVWDCVMGDDFMVLCECFGFDVVMCFDYVDDGVDVGMVVFGVFGEYFVGFFDIGCGVEEDF